MTPGSHETVIIRSTEDVVIARKAVKEWAAKVRFSLVDQTKLVTATSELARNMAVHGGGGTLFIEIVILNQREGLRLTFEDRGPGISDIDLALTDGYTTNNGLGLGLGGAKRLVDDFEISSIVDAGTRIVATRWK